MSSDLKCNVHSATRFVYALMLILLLDSRNSWWNYRKTHKMPKLFFSNNRTEKVLFWGTRKRWFHFCTHFV